MDPQNQELPVDEQFLSEMGLAGLPDDAKQAALGNILQTLNLRVAQRIADNLSEDQMDEFDRLTEGEPDEEALSNWLKKQVPNYNELINEEAGKMREEAMAVKNAVMGQPGGQAAV